MKKLERDEKTLNFSRWRIEINGQKSEKKVTRSYRPEHSKKTSKEEDVADEIDLGEEALTETSKLIVIGNNRD